MVCSFTLTIRTHERFGSAYLRFGGKNSVPTNVHLGFSRSCTASTRCHASIDTEQGGWVRMGGLLQKINVNNSFVIVFGPSLFFLNRFYLHSFKRHLSMTARQAQFNHESDCHLDKFHQVREIDIINRVQGRSITAYAVIIGKGIRTQRFKKSRCRITMTVPSVIIRARVSTSTYTLKKSTNHTLYPTQLACRRHWPPCARNQYCQW